MPPLTLENASALVAGGVTAADIAKEAKSMQQYNKPAQPQTIKVRVLRAFTDHTRKVLEKDWVGHLPRVFALEMKAANKVEFVADEPAPAPPADKPSPAKKEKGDHDAR